MCQTWPYLTTQCGNPAPPPLAPVGARTRARWTPGPAPLRQPHLRQGLIECRDRHRRAWPIICAPFWATTSSLCVSISLFLAFPLSLPYNGTDFGQYISARIVWRGLILGPKKYPKMIKNSLFLFFFLFCLCLFRIFSSNLFLKGFEIKEMAANSKWVKIRGALSSSKNWMVDTEASKSTNAAFF